VNKLEQTAPAELLALTAFKIIKSAFGQQLLGERKCFKLANFTHQETLAFLKVCEMNAEETVLSDTTIVVASDDPSNIPENYRAEETITTYRNRIKGGHGLIYIETNVQSDSQGLKNIFTLRDINFLDGSFDSEGFHVPAEIVSGAIASVFGADDGSHGLLCNRCLEVLIGLRNGGMAISVRKFAAFALEVAESRSEIAGALDPPQLDQLIGGSLLTLDLFQDKYWRSDTSEARISRRLTQNFLHAELASSPSTDLDQDKLVETCRSTIFRDRDGKELNAAQQKSWRSLCESYCNNPAAAFRAEIPYFMFEQLFTRDLKGLGLGDRVEQEIDQESSDRLSEYELLGVKNGLNIRISEEAQRFLEKEAASGNLMPLRDLLSTQTRRMVEKLAFPNPEQFLNPLIKLAEVAELFRNRSGDPGRAKIIRVQFGRNGDQGMASLGLFSFLYGATLNSISEASQLTSQDGIILKVDPKLTEIVSPPALKDSDNEDEPGDDDPVEWKPVPVEFVLLDAETGEEVDSEQTMEWYPPAIERLALFWLTTTASDRPQPAQQLEMLHDQSIEEWIQTIVSRNSSLSAFASKDCPSEIRSHQIIARLHEAAEGFQKECIESCLSPALLSEQYGEWNEILEGARETLIPEGRTNPYLEVFLRHECVLGPAGESILMLASHPIRLRWIGLYLHESEGLALKALAGELPLNSQNKSYYLNWMANLSPHQSPAVHVGPSGEPLLASNEEGWTEEFRPLRYDKKPELSESIAVSSLSEIARQVSAYLEAHPYKRDGLTVLIVSPSAPSFAAEIALAIRTGEWRDVQISIHLVIPKSLWERATTYFEKVPSENRLSGSDALFPPLQLTLYELESIEKLNESLGELEADLAIVPQFLNDDVTIQEQTAPASNEAGSFDPLQDRPTFIYGGNEGGAISVAQRPRKPDPALLNWSTIVVRQCRMSPISPQQPENTDLFELLINFQNAARLFTLLHDRSHWVITLEKYITREQIEALENRPDILTVKNAVGPGGAFTLIVSSNVGQKFIVNRLERKLINIVSSSGAPSSDPSLIRRLAEKTYRETREIAPWLTLKAMGISRVTEEILGLMAGRKILEQEFPVVGETGISVWISFDDHQDWFGGENGTRADLCRITLDQTDDGLEVDLVVLEGKLRASGYEPHGVKQVAATLKLLSDVMPSAETNDEHERVDARLWREEILSAIETVNPDAIRILNLPGSEDYAVHRIPVDMRDAFRDGRFRLRRFAGLYSICVYGQTGSLSVSSDAANPNIKIVRSFGADLLSIVRGQREGISAVQQTGHDGGAPEKEKPIPDERSAEVETSVQATEATVVTTEEPRVVDHNEGSGSEDTESPPIDVGTDKTGVTDVSLRKLTDDELERRYQQILNTYGEFNVSVRAAENSADRFVEGPASVLYRLIPGEGVAPDKIRQQGESLQVNLKLLEEQQVRFGIDSGFITIDVPKLPDDRYFVSAVALWERWNRPENDLTIPVGVDRYGKPVSINFSSSNSPHLLIGGTTGSGKSEALNTILAGLVKHYSDTELRLLLVDPKGTELAHFEEDGHLEGEIGFYEEDAIELLDRAVGEMERRYKLFKGVRAKSLADFNKQAPADQKIPWWFIVLDEYADLTSEKEAKKAIEDRLKRLAQKARAAGIHLVIATQKPAAEVISTNLRSNLPAQLALRVKSPTESRVIMDETGAETLNGMGDAFLKCEGKLNRIQCAKV
jgi:DNA segregation ATPase FtsK/SpoIIIE, S-DNA-T family